MYVYIYNITLQRTSYILKFNTGSTAQGGGGSFTDRKLIGTVSCCDAWMTERTH